MSENEESEIEEKVEEWKKALKGMPSKNVKKPDRLIEIRHTGIKKDEEKDEDIETIKDQRDILRAQLGTIVYKEFADQKEALLATVSEDKRDKLDRLIGDNPDRLEALKIQQIASGKFKEPYDWKNNPEDLTRVPPKGKVGLPSAEQKPKNSKEYIDSLYATLKNPEATPQEIKKVNMEIEGFIGNIIKGRKASGRKTYEFASIICPKCGRMIMASRRKAEIKSCPYCNWTKYVENGA